MLGGKGGDLVLAALLANEKKGGIDTLTPEQEIHNEDRGKN